jgi:hypothetical protein
MIDTREAGATLIDGLASLPTRRAMIAFLTRQRQHWSPGIVESLYEQVVRVARADVRQARRLADTAAWLADRSATTDRARRACGRAATCC